MSYIKLGKIQTSQKSEHSCKPLHDLFKVRQMFYQNYFHNFLVKALYQVQLLLKVVLIWYTF